MKTFYQQAITETLETLQKEGTQSNWITHSDWVHAMYFEVHKRSTEVSCRTKI